MDTWPGPVSAPTRQALLSFKRNGDHLRDPNSRLTLKREPVEAGQLTLSSVRR